ncbi:hypothetical protein MLD38_006615 [Melastoma candidum]|uniref:Uncharacterized protein n=1 Tax=Melastoma candidum TaxID=119954 RepID=A0ACB9RRF7_9MYRT|nr:hypothetical protein MLD38_006615 [Melastoma candidum]
MDPLLREVRFPELDIPVMIASKLSVQPSGPIPVAAGDSLYLSNLDDVIGARVFTPTVYFYRSSGGGVPSAKVIGILHDALACVLVPYYPLSGRLRETEKGKLEVFFGTDQGGLLVEARSNKSLDDLGDLTVPNPAWEPLVFKFPKEEPYKLLDMPLVIAQVTVFSCGGFSLGLRLCHCICDGLGAMQFLRAWAATAKAGRLIVDPEPCWDREIFKPRDPPRIGFPHTEFMRIEEGSNLTERLWGTKPVQKCYTITREFQARLKALAQTDSFLCTTFDALAAHVWRSWVKALDVRPSDYQLRLTFSVNARRKLDKIRLRDGFYGNVVCLACAVSTVSELAKGGHQWTTTLVRDARLGITEEYLRSTVDYVEEHRPTRLEFGGKLTITQWTRFSIYESADFGWGRPAYAGPIDLTPTPQVCVILPEGEADGMILCICLPKSATERFKELLSRVNWREGQT